MANEAVMVQQLEDRLFEATVADGTGIEKGTIMVMSSDPNTVIASSGDGETFMGILAAAKVASDGQTRMAIWQRGVFDLTIAPGGSATLGDFVKTSGANLITVADEAGVTAMTEVVGQALETGSSAEVINVLVGCR